MVLMMVALAVGCGKPAQKADKAASKDAAAPKPAAAAIDKSKLAALVNGDGITKDAYEAEATRNLARYRGQGHQLPPGIEQRIRESVLRRLIDDAVVGQKAAASGIKVTQQEIDAKFAEHKKRFRTEQAFADYLKRSSNTEENMKRDLRRNILRDRLVEKLSGQAEVPDEDVQKYYDEHLQRFVEKEQVKASRILIRVSPSAAAKDKKKARKLAKKVRRLAAKKGADFAALAKEHSNGPEASRGGQLNWFSRGRMPPAFDEVAFSLKPGALSKVVETKLGFEVILVSEKKVERQRPFDEVKSNIRNSLVARKRNEKRREVLRTLKTDAKVERLIEFKRPKATVKQKIAAPINAKTLSEQLKAKAEAKAKEMATGGGTKTK